MKTKKQHTLMWFKEHAAFKKKKQNKKKSVKCFKMKIGRAVNGWSSGLKHDVTI